MCKYINVRTFGYLFKLREVCAHKLVNINLRIIDFLDIAIKSVRLVYTSENNIVILGCYNFLSKIDIIKRLTYFNAEKYEFIVVNFANGDMVGHTGIYSAIEKAVTAVDACLKDVIEAAKAHGYDSIIIADHGNADNAVNADGSPNTAHSLNPVPCVYVTDDKNATIKDGILADVAPTILKIMGLETPADMTGNCLI